MTLTRRSLLRMCLVEYTKLRSSVMWSASSFRWFKWKTDSLKQT